MLEILQDCEFFPNNEVNDNGDLIHFALMAESKLVKMEEALSDPKWIYATKEEPESIDKNSTWELVDLPKKIQLVLDGCIKWMQIPNVKWSNTRLDY